MVSKVCRVMCTSSGWFKHIEPPQTFSNHVIGVEKVRLNRTFSNFIFTGEARCAGSLCTSSGWFKHIEPPRTYSNHIIAEITRCVEFFHMSSEWFDYTEPSLTRCAMCMCTSSGWFKRIEPPRTFSNHIIAEIARCVREFRVVRLYRTFSNYIFTGETSCAGCLCTSSGWFKRIESPRTFSNHIIAEIARCIEFFHMSSGLFDCTERSLTSSLQGKQVVQGAYALVRGGSSTSNLLEPSRTTSSQR